MLAIIIPYYKLTFFEATLESLARQTDKRFKVYIGDDASPESPIELLEKFKGKVDFVYHRFENNLGGTSLTKQWERCIALSAEEDWLMILGDDDSLGENVVEAFYNNLEEINTFKSNVIKFASQVYDLPSRKFSKIYHHPKIQDAATFYFKRFEGQVRSSLSEHIFKTKVYLKYGIKDYPLAWHSDDYAWLEFSERKPIYCINEAIVKINISSESISGNDENFVLKNQAESFFFRDLIQSKLNLFTKKDQLDLLYQIEVLTKKRAKLESKEWQYLALGYLNTFKLLPIAKFVRRYLIHLLG